MPLRRDLGLKYRSYTNTEEEKFKIQIQTQIKIHVRSKTEGMKRDLGLKWTRLFFKVSVFMKYDIKDMILKNLTG